jgi:outer membrane protein
MRMKGYPVLAVLFFGLAGSVFGQQITRIAVVDLGRIIMTYSRDGAALKDFELKKSQIQTEIDRMSEEIRRLQAQKVEADRIGDRQGAQRLESDIFRKTELLRDFVRSKQIELDDQARRISSSSDFAQAVYRQIQFISETEGYSLVLNLKSGDSVMGSVIWYSPMIDITDKVIQSLIGKAQ